MFIFVLHAREHVTKFRNIFYDFVHDFISNDFSLNVNVFQIEEEAEKIFKSMNYRNRICEGIVHACRPKQAVVADSEQSTKQMKK